MTIFDRIIRFFCLPTWEDIEAECETERLRRVARLDQLQAKLESRLDELNKPYEGLGDG